MCVNIQEFEKNILNLNHSTEGLLVCFEKKDGQPRGPLAKLFALFYPDAQAALAAVKSFFQSYLPEKAELIDISSAREKTGSTRVEDGWLGWRLSNNYLALVFECPDQESVAELLSQIKFP